MKKIKLIINKFIVQLLLNFAFDLCPNSVFKIKFASFLLENIELL